MESFHWQIISQISLGIGVVLLLAALFIAIKFRVISNIVSEISAKGGRAAAEAVPSPSVSRSLRAEENFFSEDLSDNKDGDIITVVVGQKKNEDISDTVVVGTKTDSQEDFRIVRNILLINADVEAIDNGGRNR